LDLPEDNWVIVEGNSEGHPFFMMVNDGLKDFQDRSGFPFCLLLTIQLEDVQGHKLPTDDEAEILNFIEDTTIEILSAVTLPILIGRETYFGEREILIYFPEPPDLKKIIDSMSRKLNEHRHVSIELHRDPEWLKAQRYLGNFGTA